MSTRGGRPATHSGVGDDHPREAISAAAVDSRFIAETPPAALGHGAWHERFARDPDRAQIFCGYGSGRRSGSAMRCHRDHAVFDGLPEQIVRNVVEQARAMENASTRTASSVFTYSAWRRVVPGTGRSHIGCSVCSASPSGASPASYATACPGTPHAGISPRGIGDSTNSARPPAPSRCSASPAA